MLLRLVYLAIANAFALLWLLWLLSGSVRDKDVEILALRHQLVVLQRQLGEQRVRFQPADRAWLAALLHRLPRSALRSLRLLVQPDTILRWHRNLAAHRHAKMGVVMSADVFGAEAHAIEERDEADQTGRVDPQRAEPAGQELAWNENLRATQSCATIFL